ncbi:unnamed protein product, partial [Brenthis ino]
MCLINSFQLFMIAFLFHTTGALRSCKNFNIYLSGIDETPIDTLNQSSCDLLKDLANECGSVTLEIELDEFVSKYYEENYDISIQTIQTNITLINTDIFNNSTIVGGSEKSDTNLPVVVLVTLASVASGGVISYFLAEKIKTMLQSGSYCSTSNNYTTISTEIFKLRKKCG